MIRVVICDDEITMCNQLEEYCKRWGQQHNIIVTVRRYNNPGIFLVFRINSHCIPNYTLHISHTGFSQIYDVFHVKFS